MTCRMSYIYVVYVVRVRSFRYESLPIVAIRARRTHATLVSQVDYSLHILIANSLINIYPHIPTVEPFHLGSLQFEVQCKYN